MKIPETAARAMVRLLGDVASVQGALAEKRRQLMDGLCEIISADRWYWSMVGEIDPNRNPAHTIFLQNGFTDEEFVAYLKTQEHPDIKWMTAPFFEKLAASRGQLTRTGQQLDPENRLAQADILPLMLQAGVGAVILSGRATCTGQMSGIFIARRLGRNLFSPLEARIAHIVLSEVGWLHDGSWPEYPREGISSLSPRLRTVLTLLLQGGTESQADRDRSGNIDSHSGRIHRSHLSFVRGAFPSGTSTPVSGRRWR
ncbi:MAG: hypothetical protein R3F19_17760 [Verrucomicrobiales bacterium]